MRSDMASEPAANLSAAEVLTEATRRAARILGLPDPALAQVLGVDPGALQAGGGVSELDSPAGERASLFLRAFRDLHALAGDSESCRRWMATENATLRGVPGELIRSGEGLRKVADYLEAARTERPLTR